ncbi:histidine phosphatase family protein [Sphingomonas sp. LaA6.9]|uniref:histidine phosphatase family protein n=1 Tax=Sphingomonas sp. LaA6.9 TaxID=2919914 RepID=UPI001F502F17|nr:histidine phosphatase family protein [Sphingomonas sp. LaA6.9]MCJ8159661.1 histidine phosphatase family protein [Sphingomonas sp. LaA6.9]
MSGLTVHLLRHGAPALTGRMLGSTDCAETPEGVAACLEQTEALEFARLVSSPLRRAAAAAGAIGARGNIPVTIDERWREIDFGDWDGLSSADVDPAALGRFWDDPDMHAPPGGERWSALTARIGGAIDALDADTLVVTHGGAMRAALAVLFGFSQPQLWAFDLPYASVLSLRIWPGVPRQAQIVGLWP